jgi:hypothetical protein
MLKTLKLLIAVLFSISLTSCATILKGYEDRVDLENAPEDIRVFSKDGIEIPVSSRDARTYSEEQKKFVMVKIKTISLRTNKEHVLLLKSGDKEKRVEIYPKLGAGWLMLDIITGGFPAVIDMHTGNWNHFNSISSDF